METVRAVALTREAARRLRAAAGSGRVHSAYERTVNLSLDGLDEAGWLSLHGPGPIPSRPSSPPGSYRILDLGADEFTVGRPHPMLDPEARAARVREAGRDPGVGVVLVDLVLGRGAHPDPAAPLAAAIRDARVAAAADGRALAVVASVVGHPLINTGIAGRRPGTGQVGAGVVRAPLGCFNAALEALAAGAGARA